MGVLLMMMTVGGLIVAALLLVVSLFTKKAGLTRFTLGGVAVWFVFYGVMLFGFSIASTEKTLAMNEPKEHCGFYLDCHMHTAVTGVRKTKTIGDRTANGEFHVVTVKVSSSAKAATLSLGGLKLIVVDDDGKYYPRAVEVENPRPVFTQPVMAGASFEQDVVFDLPTDVKNPRIDMYDYPSLIEKVLINDEDSFLHKRTYFKLGEQSVAQSVQ
ncbi:MAG: hypothetical protein ACKVQW_17225 [Pyrinomonadaceae bacterium]